VIKNASSNRRLKVCMMHLCNWLPAQTKAATLNYESILLRNRPSQNTEGDSRSEPCGHIVLADF